VPLDGPAPPHALPPPITVHKDGAALRQLAHTAVTVEHYRAETCCIVGNYYSLKQQRAKAIQYFPRGRGIKNLSKTTNISPRGDDCHIGIDWEPLLEGLARREGLRTVNFVGVAPTIYPYRWRAVPDHLVRLFRTQIFRALQQNAGIRELSLTDNLDISNVISTTRADDDKYNLTFSIIQMDPNYF